MRALICCVTFFVLSSPSYAQAFGAWQTGVSTDNDQLYAATVNESGDLLGNYCYIATGNCVWVFATATICKLGQSVEMLANTDTGYEVVKAKCAGPYHWGGATLYRSVFTNTLKMLNLVQSANVLGFAIPLKGDQFRVVRFSLNGSNLAIKSILSEIQKLQHRKQSPPSTPNTQPNTTDQTL